jgi:hypothetical protein
MIGDVVNLVKHPRRRFVVWQIYDHPAGVPFYQVLPMTPTLTDEDMRALAAPLTASQILGMDEFQQLDWPALRGALGDWGRQMREIFWALRGRFPMIEHPLVKSAHERGEEFPGIPAPRPTFRFVPNPGDEGLRRLEREQAFQTDPEVEVRRRADRVRRGLPAFYEEEGCRYLESAWVGPPAPWGREERLVDFHHCPGSFGGSLIARYDLHGPGYWSQPMDILSSYRTEDLATEVRRVAYDVATRHGLHTTSARHNPGDEGRRRRARRAALDPRGEAAVLRDRLRTHTVPLDNVRLAAYLGYVPAQLAIDWTPPEPPFGSPDAVVLLLSQDNEWGHRMAALWAYALCKSTEWIWEEVLRAIPGLSTAPRTALLWIAQRINEGDDPCHSDAIDVRERRRAAVWEMTQSLGDPMFQLDGLAHDAAPDVGAESGAMSYELSFGAVQWLEALEATLWIWGLNMHSHARASMWGNRHTIGTLWVSDDAGHPEYANVPLYARYARNAYRSAVWAVDFYRAGNNRHGPVMDKAQLDVEAWTREIMIPELLA